ncbi:hypothetical protein [Microbacterium sp. W4I20]|uniref:hypothetical protein n=1 Tax=Microbacterium sp. W4I20 TaxID=3042262 RepID=UPI00277F8187|nr:hypothetical protein [Microbacterium sp. W4I20]MDQ0728663.1 apolipoprotein N-acyltransferase [Microbacterium sp. W4I20]
MSEPGHQPDPSLIRLRRAIRRSTILWSVVVLGLVVFALGNWMTLAWDGGGSPYTWAMAIGGTVIAAATAVFVAAIRYMTRDLRRQDACP